MSAMLSLSSRRLDLGPGRCHGVFTVTRMLLPVGSTGGQKKLPWPSLPGKPCQPPGMPSCSSPASSTARSRKHGVIIGQYSPIIHGCPDT
jgi:hypothetical protein